MNKQQLRKECLKKRLNLSQEHYAELNVGLLNQFQKINLTGVRYIHIFLPFKKKKEPNTTLLINWLKRQHPKIQLVYPKADFANNSMRHFLDNGELQLAHSYLGILEPVTGNEVDVAMIDMIIVPLLAFDECGYRVGYGKGFYDRFMAQCKHGTQFIGLSFFDPVNAIDDLDQYDIPLHGCITPQKIWTFDN